MLRKKVATSVISCRRMRENRVGLRFNHKNALLKLVIAFTPHLINLVI